MSQVSAPLFTILISMVSQGGKTPFVYRLASIAFGIFMCLKYGAPQEMTIIGVQEKSLKVHFTILHLLVVVVVVVVMYLRNWTELRVEAL